MPNYDKPFDSAVREISKVLPKKSYEYRKVYSGKSLEIRSKNDEEDTRLYIKIVALSNGFAIDLSNINLDPSIQHIGIFTAIVNNIKKSRTITEIWVSSVLTDNMHKACIKLCMIPNDSIMGYKFKI